MENSHRSVETTKGFVLEGMGPLVFEPAPHFFPPPLILLGLKKI